MKKIYRLLILSISIALLTACSCSGGPTTSLSDSGNLSDILAKAKQHDSLSYEMISDLQGTSFSQKMWLKNNQLRTESEQSGQKMIMIINSKTQKAYNYMPEQNMALEINYGDYEDTINDTPTDLSESLNEYNPLIKGTETIDGKTATIVEYSTGDASVKMWIWQQYGLVLKMETKTPAGTSTVQFKNYDFSDIPDSMFELPEGVQIMNMPNF